VQEELQASKLLYHDSAGYVKNNGLKDIEVDCEALAAVEPKSFKAGIGEVRTHISFSLVFVGKDVSYETKVDANINEPLGNLASGMENLHSA